MACRRRQGMGRSVVKEERDDFGGDTASYSGSLAAHQGGPTYDYTSMGSTDGFWGGLARKARSILDDHTVMMDNNPTVRKKLDALTTSMNRIGDSVGNATEEGLSMVEHKTADIIQEMRKLQMGRKRTNDEQFLQWQQQSPPESNQPRRYAQGFSRRKVSMATAAKAKLLLRELKTFRADLAFAKHRCSQLEEENTLLRDAREKGVNQAEDDLIRLQLETLVAEKARLAQENLVYERENLFLREIVEYHQLTMQDVVYLDEDIEEVTEVYPIPAVSRTLSSSSISPISPRSNTSLPRIPSVSKEIMNLPFLPRDNSKTEVSKQ